MKEIKGKCQVTGSDLDELADKVQDYIASFDKINYAQMDETDIYRLHSLKRVYIRLKRKAMFNGTRKFNMTFDIEELLTIKRTLMQPGYQDSPAMRRVYLLIDPIVHPGIQLKL